MIGERTALVVGLFVIPGILLWLGHHFRDGSLRRKRIFWGGVIGHSLAMILTLVVLMAPPVWWAGGNMMRDVAIHWSLLCGALIGALVGGAGTGKQG